MFYNHETMFQILVTKSCIKTKLEKNETKEVSVLKMLPNILFNYVLGNCQDYELLLSHALT